MSLFRKKPAPPPRPSTQIPSTLIIFLDADGVLNDALSDVTKLNVMEVNLLALLERLVRLTNARIVLSTTWRYTAETRKEAQQYFEAAGIPLWISVTKNLVGAKKDIGRRLEIIEWLTRNTDYFTQKGRVPPLDPQRYVSYDSPDLPPELYSLPHQMVMHVTNWIAIDDLNLEDEPGADVYPDKALSDHFVMTIRKIGLTPANITEAFDKLGVVEPPAEKAKKKGFFSGDYPNGFCAQCMTPTQLRDAEQGIYFCRRTCQERFYDEAM